MEEVMVKTVLLFLKLESRIIGGFSNLAIWFLTQVEERNNGKRVYLLVGESISSIADALERFQQSHSETLLEWAAKRGMRKRFSRMSGRSATWIKFNLFQAARQIFTSKRATTLVDEVLDLKEE